MAGRPESGRNAIQALFRVLPARLVAGHTKRLRGWRSLQGLHEQFDEPHLQNCGNSLKKIDA